VAEHAYRCLWGGRGRRLFRWPCPRRKRCTPSPSRGPSATSGPAPEPAGTASRPALPSSTRPPPDPASLRLGHGAWPRWTNGPTSRRNDTPCRFGTVDFHFLPAQFRAQIDYERWGASINRRLLCAQMARFGTGREASQACHDNLRHTAGQHGLSMQRYCYAGLAAWQPRLRPGEQSADLNIYTWSANATRHDLPCSACGFHPAPGST
jgi:hypothetical protein